MIPRPLITPRGSLRLEPKGELVLARVTSQEDEGWQEHARAVVERVRLVSHPALVPVRDIIAGDEGLEVVYAPRAGSAPLDGSSPEEAARAAADAAEGLAALAPLPGEPVRCGPFVPGLLLRDTAGGGALLAAGLWHVAYQLDRGMRGRAMTMRHFITGPDELRGHAHGPKTEVYFLAALLFQLLAGREPYPIESEFAYLQAVRGGARIPLEEALPDTPPALAEIIERCLDVTPAVRPDLQELAAALRGASRLAAG